MVLAAIPTTHGPYSVCWTSRGGGRQGPDPDRRRSGPIGFPDPTAVGAASNRLIPDMARTGHLAAPCRRQLPILAQRPACHPGRARHRAPAGGRTLPGRRRAAGFHQRQSQRARARPQRNWRVPALRRGIGLDCRWSGGRAPWPHRDSRRPQWPGDSAWAKRRVIASTCSSMCSRSARPTMGTPNSGR